ncbi:MAG: sulfatase, partial [Candidatus Thorarchaeota archaeon]
MIKRIILITIDCWRKDRLSHFGYDSKILPNINKLSKSAVIFQNMISNSSNTAPSFFSLFTSKIPVVDGLYTPIPNNLIQFSEILKKNNIFTCAIHSNPHLGRICNYQKGFDDYFDLLEKPLFSSWRQRMKNKVFKILEFLRIKNQILKILSLILNIIKIKIKNDFISYIIIKPYVDAKITTSLAIEWLSKNINTDFFLWIHYMDPHRPYLPPKKFINNIIGESVSNSNIISMNKIVKYFKPYSLKTKKFEEKYLHLTNILYDAELSFVDHYIGILISYLKKKKAFEDTQIILTADHGEAIFEHDLLGHQVCLYDELIKIPLIIKINKIHKQRIIKEHVELIDIAPTILDILNIPSEESFKGLSLLPLITDDIYPKKKDYIVSALLHHKNLVFTT